jgi:hypothetical protein
MLAKRLISRLSASDELEESMILKLKVRIIYFSHHLSFFFRKRAALSLRGNGNECLMMFRSAKR